MKYTLILFFVFVWSLSLSNRLYGFEINATNMAGEDLEQTNQKSNFTCGNPVTFTYRGQQVTYGTIERGGLCWLDRNMGASRVPFAIYDELGNGDLFQWGRGDDGHQIRTSVTSSTLSSTDTPGHGYFIVAPNDPWNWRSPQNNNLWQGVNGINNPCPTGWRLPTEAELYSERQSWSSNNSYGAHGSTLKWLTGGGRNNTGEEFVYAGGSGGGVWSSTTVGSNARALFFSSFNAGMISYNRANGYSVRCVKDIESQVNIPSVSTLTVYNITQISARGGGNVTSDGGATVTERGIVYSIYPNPTTANNKVTAGSGMGSFTANLIGLQPGTTYYVRAYAINSAGTAYGNQVSFNTDPAGSPPIANFIGTPTSGTAPLAVQFTDQSTNNPTNWSWDFGDGSTSAQRNPSKTYNTAGTYTVRLTATNSYGSNTQTRNNYITVSAPSGPETGTLTDPRDGQTYKWVKIGDQVWMAENLKYLPSVVNAGTGSETIPYYYVNNYNGTNVSAAKSTANYQKYGVLYNWSAVMAGSSSSSMNPSGVQGVCPPGWHVPSDAEWTQLVNYLFNQGFPNLGVANGTGNALKSCRQINSHLGGDCDTSEHPRWDSHDTHSGFDEFGFSALPAGMRNSNGTFSSIGGGGYWWSSTENSSTKAWRRMMLNYGGLVYILDYDKTIGFSVRCVSDTESQVSIPSVTTSGINNITQDSARGGGDVTSDGGATVTERGIVYSTSQTPTTSNNKVTSGSGTGSFIANMTGLSPGTTYYVRAFATNSAGTAYGSQRTFTTQAADQHAAISSPTVDQITSTSARICYTVTSLGNPPVTNHGISYGTSTNPEQSISQISGGNTTGTICNTISGLSPNTTYYLRTFTSAASGTTYQGNVSFTTTGTEGTSRRTVYVNLGITQPNVEACFQSGYSVSFVVKGQDQVAINDAVVTFGGQTKPAGAYVFEDISPGQYSYRITANRHHDVTGNVTVVNKDEVVSVNMTRNAYEIIATANPPEGGNVSGGGLFAPGVQANLMASPRENYAFVSWMEGGIIHATTPDYRFNVTSDRVLVANFQNVTSVADPDKQQAGMHIYPNPARDKLNIEIKNSHAISYIRVIDLLGQEVIRISNLDQSQHQLDVNHLNTGMYIIQVFTNENVYMSKFQVTQ